MEKRFYRKPELEAVSFTASENILLSMAFDFEGIEDGGEAQG